MKTLVTHSAKFHTDDVFGTAVVTMFLEKKGESVKVIRSFEQEVWEKADYVLDVGRIYNPKKNRFDHHQGDAGGRPNGIPYATFGLVWKQFGKALCGGSQKVADSIDEDIVAYIDADDNGTTTYKSLFPDIKIFTIDGYIGIEVDSIQAIEFNERDEMLAAFDKKFAQLVEWAKGVITSAILKASEKIKLEKEAIKAYEKSDDKRIIILKRFLPYSFANFKEPLLIIYPDMRVVGCWCVKTVKLKNEPLKARIDFPKKWWGKIEGDLDKATGIPGGKFSHLNGFLISTYSKDAAIEIAQKALIILKK